MTTLMLAAGEGGILRHACPAQRAGLRSYRTLARSSPFDKLRARNTVPARVLNGLRIPPSPAAFDGVLSAPREGAFAEHWLTEAVIRQKHLADQGRAGVSVMKTEPSPPDHVGINPLCFWRASARKLHSERRASQPPADAERMSPTRGAVSAAYGESHRPPPQTAA